VYSRCLFLSIDKVADETHAGKGRVPWHLIKVNSSSSNPMKITKKKSKAQYCLHGWKPSWKLPNESRSWQTHRIDAFQRAIRDGQLYFTKLGQNSSGTGNTTTRNLASNKVVKKRSRRF
jgi:hypothetical protein